jgi:hypothetical protein
MRNLLGILLLSFSASVMAHAAMQVPAPEFDPASAVTALTLLSGGLAVIRGRRKRK